MTSIRRLKRRAAARALSTVTLHFRSSEEFAALMNRDPRQKLALERFLRDALKARLA